MTLPFQNLIPFIGIVQSESDPSLLGRCKVRCFGIHPPADDPSVPTELLPWAIRLDGTVGAVQSPDPRPGELVFGFFLDGRDAQYPAIVGAIPSHNIGLLSNAWADGSSETINKSITLANAPNHTGVDLEGSSLVAASAANQADDLKSGSGDYEVKIPSPDATSGKGAASLQSSEYQGSYVSAGENVSLYHKSGTVVQINSDGVVIISSTNDLFTDVDGNHTDVSASNRDIIIKNGQFNINVMNGDCNLTVNGDMNQKVTGNYTLDVSGMINVTSGQQTEFHAAKFGIQSNSSVDVFATKGLFTASETLGINTAGAASLNFGGATNILSKGLFVSSTEELHLEGTNSFLSSSGTMDLNAGGEVKIEGTRIDLGNGATSSTTAAPDSTAIPTVGEYVDPGATTASTAPKGSGLSGRSRTLYAGGGGLSTNPDQSSELNEVV